MSKKSSKGPKPKAPRPLDAIRNEYQQVLSHAGQVQYEKTIKEEELKQVNSRLLALNQEGAARIELDKKSPAVDLPAPQPTEKEASNESV